MKSHFWRKKVIIASLCTQRCYGRHNVSRKSVNKFGLQILLHGVISLPDAKIPGRVAQSVTCLATDACLTADPGVASSIPARYHTFVEIDHEIISTVILLPSADLFKKGCQLQAKVCAQITG